jgi:hypothetical protein
MKNEIDLSKLKSIDSMLGEDDGETRELRELYKRAENFLKAFNWAGKIERAYFGLGVENIVGVFLFAFIPKSPDVDNLLWVIVGDIPPAYLVTDDAPDSARALQVYIREMRNWIAAVKAGRSVSDLIPVDAPPTMGNANDLSVWLDFIEREIVVRESS